MSVVEERYIAPRVNVVERDEEMVIEAEVPGVSRGQAEIEMRDGVLYLKAHANRNGGAEGAYRLQERAGASYYRSFRLGDTIDPTKIDAVLKDGLLTVRLSKSEKIKPRVITVS